jgi:hypothetical protein
VVPLTRRRFVASALVLFGATAVVAPSAAADNTLVVADAETDERLFEIAVDQGDEVTLTYTHSVQKTPVKDVYVVDGSELRAERSEFRSFGAGLPTEDVERTDEGYVVEGSGSYDELRVAPGEIAGHELVIGDERYDLAGTAEGRVVIFLAERTVTDAITDHERSVRTDVDTGRTIESAVRVDSTETAVRTTIGAASTNA